MSTRLRPRRDDRAAARTPSRYIRQATRDADRSAMVSIQSMTRTPREYGRWTGRIWKQGEEDGARDRAVADEGQEIGEGGVEHEPAVGPEQGEDDRLRHHDRPDGALEVGGQRRGRA